MKTTILSYLTLTGLCLLSNRLLADQTAQARLYCVSLQFQQARDSTTEYVLDLSTLSVGDNGELAPYDSTRHYSYLDLYDDWWGDYYPSGWMYLAIPNTGDANGNGFSDFFESSQPVSGASSSGTYTFPQISSGTLQATWNRAAGSSFGNCVLKFKPAGYTWLTFSFTFQLLEYQGPLAYTPGSNTVSATVNLTQTDNSASQLLGPLSFVKQTPNQFNSLTLQPGCWTNASSQSLTFTNFLFQRDTQRLTNYYGYVIFDDYDPGTADADFQTWMLSIDDTNDVNQNHIPDFSDNPPSPLPRRPSLSLALGSSNLRLSISGDVGHSHVVQEATTPNPTNWLTVTSVTLTASPQVVTLPLVSAKAKFWRVLAQ
jgi:hypothetical protein